MKLNLKDYLLIGMAVVIVILLIFWPQKESKFTVERERLADSVKVQTERVHRLQFDTIHLGRENRRLEGLLVSRQAEVSKLRESRGKVEKIKKLARSFTDEQTDSTYQKLFPVPDSILFASGSKANYVVHVQKQVYENLIELDYSRQMVQAMDSTIAVFDKLVFQKDLIIGNQKQTIGALTNLNETLLKSQVNDMGEISKLKKKKRFAGFVLKVGLPVAFGAGLWLGLK